MGLGSSDQRGVPKMTSYTGGCHCGEIRFAVTGKLEDLAECNCSICRRTGFIHWEVEPEHFSLIGDEAAIETYQFGTMTSRNHFCRRCGISPFRRSRTGPDMIDVNVRCLDDVQLEGLQIEPFDGVNWEETMGHR
jgi:hypothetical protein